MKVKDVWQVSPQACVFLRTIDGERREKPVAYVGAGRFSDFFVHRIVPTTYPMYRHVLELDIDSCEEVKE